MKKAEENYWMEEYDYVIALCSQLNSNFIDEDFPHTSTSIGELRRKEKDAVAGEPPESYVWLRPQEISTHDRRSLNWVVFRDPHPSDIEQGSLGDCWLLSAMALIAERPDVLINIFLTKEYSPIGAYQLKICINGKWEVTMVDDFFPCRPHSKSMAFAVGREKQLWVPLIEKAIAKQLGGYDKLVGGWTIEGLAMLTGEPCERVNLEDIKEEVDKQIVWAKLLSAREARFIIGCSCGSGNRKVDDDVFKTNGLLTRHAYSILDVIQQEDYKLIRLRNPWGRFVWNGAWSDEWPEWDPGLKAVLLSSEYASQTGAFWMSFEDFLAHFNSVDIAKIRTHCGWSEFRQPIQIGHVRAECDKAVRFFIEEPTEVDLMISVHRINSNETLSELMIHSRRKVNSNVTTKDFFLNNGEYVVLCHSFSTLGMKKIDGSIVIHSSRPIYTDQLQVKPKIYVDALVQIILKAGKTHKIHSKLISRSMGNRVSGLFLMLDNLSKNHWARIKTNFSDSVNVLSSRGAVELVDVLPPLSRQVIIILTALEPTQIYEIKYEYKEIVFSKEQVLSEGASHSPEFSNKAISVLHSTYPLNTFTST